MSFWKSFLGAAASNAIRDAKKEEEKRKEWNKLYDELFSLDIEFSDFLTSVGVGGVYCHDARILDEGRSGINAEKRKLENYKKKIKEYISLGGKASNVYNYEDIDDYLAKAKYLKSVGYLDEQDDWIQMDMEMLQPMIQTDIQAKKIYQEALAKKAEEDRRDKLMKTVGSDIYSLSGVEFEAICKSLVEKMGFITETTKASGDGGIDIIAYNHQPLLSGKYIIQCKRYSGNVGEPIIRDLYGVVMSERANKGILMTTGHFSNHAISFAEGKPLELIDGMKMDELLTQYTDYKKMESQKLIISSDEVATLRGKDAPIQGLSAQTSSPAISSLQETTNARQLDVESFVGYDTIRGSKYIKWEDTLRDDPASVKARCKLVEIFHQCITSKLIDGSSNSAEIKAASVMLSDLIAPLLSNDNYLNASREQQYLYFMALVADGQCSLWQGNILDAIRQWDKVITTWKELDGTVLFSETFKGELICSVISCLRVLGYSDLANDYRNHFINLVANEIEQIEQSGDSQNMLRLCGDRIVFEKLQDNSSVSIAINFGSLDDNSLLMCERGISFDCILTSCGLSVDALEDTLSIVGENSATTPILSGLSSYSSRVLEQVKAYFNQYF